MNRQTSAALLLVGCLTAVPVQAERPADPADGQAHELADGAFEVWDAPGDQWIDPLGFWLAFAQRRGGLTWGRADSYPPYGDVNEHDTLLVELDSGPCLMEFFHRRWRRANDVRRWAPEFNEFGGCPDVFN